MRLLLIEDETRLAQGIKRGLEKQGFAVDHIDDGRKAAEHIYIHHSVYDGIILDLSLPSMSGEEICVAVRDRGIKLPILILTAKDQTASKVAALNMGADDYMVKPFTFTELVARIQALLRRSPDARPSELIVGQLRLDPGYRTVFLGQHSLSLTVKEFSLLEFFMQHPDEVLDREFILDHVWDFNFNSFSNVVDVHVKNLRKKFSEYTDEELVETVSGVGYRLKAQVS